jgi:hypothetical protein
MSAEEGRMFQKLRIFTNKRRTNPPEADMPKTSGFLVKRAVKSGSNWRSRYFVLSDNALTYYIDQKGAKKGAAKGTILFTEDSSVTARDVEAIAFCFSIVTASKTLYVAAQSEDDMNEWILAIQEKIENLANTKRGYMNKRAVCVLPSTPFGKTLTLLHASGRQWWELEAKIFHDGF